MIYCFYEHPRDYSSRGLQRSACGLGQGYSRGEDRPKNRRSSSDAGRPEAGLDRGCSGVDQNEPESMGPSCESRGLEALKDKTRARKAFSINASDCPASGGAFRAVSSGVWPESSALGRSDSGRTLKASIRPKNESAASPELDASAWISLKTGQLYVSSSPTQEAARFRRELKKTSKSGTS